MLFIAFITGSALILVVFLIKFGVLVPSKRQRQPHISLTVGVPLKLPCIHDNVSWYSDNPLLSINAAGEAVVWDDYRFPQGQGTIYALSNTSKARVCTYAFTVVPWTANKSNIAILKVHAMIDFLGIKIQYPNTRLSSQYLLPSMVIHAVLDGWLYYSVNNTLYKTADNFRSKEKIGTLPFRPGKQRMISTHFGHFLRGEQGVYYSKDLKSWALSLKTKHPAWLLDNMDVWQDSENQKAYIYVSEYSVVKGEDHHIYKGTVDASNNPRWEVIVTVFSEAKMKQDTSIFSLAARHVHLVKVDPYTGDLYYGTGDYDKHSMIKRSRDFGKTFQLLALGSQEYRTLGIWFTEKYIYWNMDQPFPDQMIFRVARKHLEEHGTLTPILKSGKTKIGVDYYVYSQNADGFFPTSQGEKFTETIERQLNEEHQVIALSDPVYNKKELVANLTNGSHWSTYDVKNSEGDVVTLLSTTAEGFFQCKTRDNLGRVFGIKENASGSVTVTELRTVAPYDSKNEMARIEAIAQGEDGVIYFQSFHSVYGGSVVEGVLHWNDRES